jgi:hypothetical protein
MAKLTDFDLPEGWENLWNLIFRPFGPGWENSLTTKAAIKPKPSYAALILRSFFVMWESLWDSFQQSRKNAWTAYWITLPFGSHSGAGGWPGSGYSAFVYINAPRYKLGLELLLDPPGFPPPGTEILINGGFTGSYSPWAKGSQWFWYQDQMRISFTDIDYASLWEINLPLHYLKTYRWAFDIKISPRASPPAGIIKIYLGAYYTLSGTIDLSGYSSNEWHHIEKDIICYQEPTPPKSHVFRINPLQFNPVYPYYSYFDNFSLKELP